MEVSKAEVDSSRVGSEVIQSRVVVVVVVVDNSREGSEMKI